MRKHYRFLLERIDVSVQHAQSMGVAERGAACKVLPDILMGTS